MKTKIVTSVMTLSIFFATFAFANEPNEPDKQDVALQTLLSKNVSKYVGENLAYPAFALQENIECCVWVEITIQENGSFKVTRCNCMNERMKKEVTSSIENLHKKSDFYATYAGQRVFLKIKYNLI